MTPFTLAAKASFPPKSLVKVIMADIHSLVVQK
jgi:hypothetical protein